MLLRDLLIIYSHYIIRREGKEEEKREVGNLMQDRVQNRSNTAILGVK